MDGTTTLFDTDAPGHSATVEVLGVIFCAEDDGYAVLRGPGRRVGRGLRPGRAGRTPGRRRPRRSQRRVADAHPLRPPAACPGSAAARPGRPRGPHRLPDLAAPHRPGPRRTPGRRARRGCAAARSRPTRRASSPRCAESAAIRPRSRPSPGTPAAPIRDLHVQLAPHGLAHLAAPIHARFGERSMAILHEDPYRLTEVARGRLRPRRQDRPRRRRAAGVEPPRPGRRRLRPGRGRAAGQQLPAPGGADRADRKLLGLDPDPEVLGEARGLSSTKAASTASSPTPARSPWRATLAARALAPPHLDHDPGETPPQDAEDTELTDEQWSAVRGAFGVTRSRF